jgi:protein SCO1
VALMIGEGVETSEAAIAAHVDALTAAGRQADLLDLLREDHPIFDQRGAAAVSRLRGWILLALARGGVSHDALPFVLEELEAGLDPYPVGAAARALRAYGARSEGFAPFLRQALGNMAGRDEPLSFETYGEYAVESSETSPIREILLTLGWLGPAAKSVLADLEALRDQPGILSQRLCPDFERALATIRGRDGKHDGCCELPEGVRAVFSWCREGDAAGSIAQTLFEDQSGARVAFTEFFHGRPTIVVFFYTRCDNPLKCSLTVTKLGRVQELLRERGLGAVIGTAAITYDPGFDSPDRLRSFGERRGVRFDAVHRMLRAVDGMDALRRHFHLGVNFIGSLVNRHRIEAYVLDAQARVVWSFERLRWTEEELVARAAAVANENPLPAGTSTAAGVSARPPEVRKRSGELLRALPSLALAFLPKCPVCWATYLSALGLAGLEPVARLTWIQPLLIAAILINVVSVWLRARTTGRMAGACLSMLGALAIIGSRLGAPIGPVGVMLTLAGSALTALDRGFRLRRVGSVAR